MSWTNVPFKNPGDPVTAENWNGLVGNFAALADGEPGAPRLVIPGTVQTAEVDPQAVLHADGADGVRWARTSLETRTGTGRLAGVAAGIWIVHGIMAYHPPPRSGEAAYQYRGMALLTNGAIAFQFATDEGGGVVALFSFNNGDCVMPGPGTFSYGSLYQGMIGVRVG